jgi:hypothetical protein
MKDIFTVTQHVYLMHIHRTTSISVVDSVEKETRHVPPCHDITSDLQSLSHKKVIFIGQTIYSYANKDLKIWIFLAVFKTHEKQGKKSLRTVHFNT